MRKITSPGRVILFSAILILNLSANSFAGIVFTPGQGVTLAGADGVIFNGAEGITLAGADGKIFTGTDGVTLAGADGITLAGADAFTYIGDEGVTLAGADGVGIRSFDPELAWLLNALPADSNAINVFVVFYRMPTASDLDALRTAGVFGGTIFNNLPMVMINATKSQIAAISTLRSVRTIYSNKTFE